MGAGPERPAGIDHEVERRCRGAAPMAAARPAGRRARSGRWNSRQRSAQSSAISVVRHVDERTAGRGPQVGQRGQLARRAVDRVLDHVGGDVDLLDPARRQLEQLGQHQLGLARGGRGGRGGARLLPAEGALQLGEHALVGAKVLVGQRGRPAAGGVPAARGLRWRGMTTLTTIRRSPCRRPRSDGIPLPRSASISWGWVPAGISSSTGPSSVGTSRVVPSAASGAATSTAVSRSSPSRTNRGSSVTADQHVQVAGGAAALTGVAAAGDPDPLAARDAGRNVDRDPLLLGRRPRPWHTEQGFLATRPSPPQ